MIKISVFLAASCRDSLATFDNLGEIFPDENYVLTNSELLVEVRTMCFLHNRLDGIMEQKWLIQIIEYHKGCAYFSSKYSSVFLTSTI